MGKAQEFICKMTGSGDFLASDLTAEVVEAPVLGSGDIEVRVTNALRARISRSGDIKYFEDPEKQDLALLQKDNTHFIYKKHRKDFLSGVFLILTVVFLSGISYRIGFFLWPYPFHG